MLPIMNLKVNYRKFIPASMYPTEIHTIEIPYTSNQRFQTTEKSVILILYYRRKILPDARCRPSFDP